MVLSISHRVIPAAFESFQLRAKYPGAETSHAFCVLSEFPKQNFLSKLDGCFKLVGFGVQLSPAI